MRHIATQLDDNVITEARATSLQHTATHCTTHSWTTIFLLKREPLHCNTLHYTNTLQHDVARCNTAGQQLHHWRRSPFTATLCNTLTQCNTLQHSWTTTLSLKREPLHCNTLQHIATQLDNNFIIEEGAPKRNTHCNTLQHTATRCNILQHSWTTTSSLKREPLCLEMHCVGNDACHLYVISHNRTV